MDDLTIKDLYSEDPIIPRRIYCDFCGKHTRLREANFSKRVSGIDIAVNGLLELHCDNCDKSYWPDGTRLALIQIWERAQDNNKSQIQSTRKKRDDDFGYTKIKFLYDPDDYFYIPGLTRENSIGFLTPVFFNKRVLIKFDARDDYRLRFASRTYGGIYTANYTINFGINQNEKVVMWLGDIANLPEYEQYYLRSENVPSDHCIGSEFYDGQIECIFTDSSPEDTLIQARSDFLDAAREYFKSPISHLDDEMLQAIKELIPPVHFTAKEQSYFCDLLNRICAESLSSDSLTRLLNDRGIVSEKMGTLKKLQNLLQHESPEDDLATIVIPLFVAYDLRVVNSHLQSKSSKEMKLAICRKRLRLPADAVFDDIYNTLIKRLGECYIALRRTICPQTGETTPSQVLS